MSVGDLVNREERPAYVRFERRPMEDKAASIREGRYVAKDIDFALVTPPYSKDCVEQKVTQWLENLERNLRDGRIPESWATQWKAAYQKWKAGEEMPLNGTPIKGWGVISPAQQATLIAMHCLTVEDLALINDEGLRRIGMGAIELRDKAKNWLASMNDHGAISVKMAALEQENRVLQASLDTLTKQVEALKSLVPKYDSPPLVVSTPEITAADLMNDEPDAINALEDTPAPRRGRPPKQTEVVI